MTRLRNTVQSEISAVRDRATASALRAIAELTGQWNGDRGDTLDRVITLRDLIADTDLSRAANRLNRGAGALPPPDGTAPSVPVPSAPTNFNVTTGLSMAFLSWDNPSIETIAHTEVWRAATDALGTAVLVGTTSAYLYSDPIGLGASWYYWVRFVNTNGVPGPFNATAGSIANIGLIGGNDLTDLIITAAKLADGAVDLGGSKITGVVSGQNIANNAIDLQHFFGEYKPIERVTSLPNPVGYTGTPIVFLTTDGKLYRYTAGAWVKSTSAADITGQITETQIEDDSISTPKLQANSVTSAIIAANQITGDHIVAGVIQASHIAAGSIGVNELVVGDFTNQIENGTFEAGFTGWDVSGAAWTTMAGRNSATSAAVIPDGATNSITSRNFIRVSQFQDVYTELFYSSDLAFAGQVDVDVLVFDGAGLLVQTLQALSTTAASTSWQLLNGTVTPNHVDTASYKIRITVTGAAGPFIRFDDVFTRPTVVAAYISTLAVQTAHIADAAITSAKIANLAVGNAAIQNGAITNAKIGNLAVDSAKIADAAIVAAKIADAQIGSAKLAGTIQSDIYNGTGRGWQINRSGGATFGAPFKIIDGAGNVLMEAVDAVQPAILANNIQNPTIYRQASEPSAPEPDDYWYHTGQSILYQFDGVTWVVIANNFSDSAQLLDSAGWSETAIWANVTGTGRPADNATVGARAGTNLQASNGTVVNDVDVLNDQVFNADRTVSATLTVATSGVVHSGQTAFNVGTGMWMGYVGGEFKWSLGSGDGDFVTFNADGDGELRIAANLATQEYTYGTATSLINSGALTRTFVGPMTTPYWALMRTIKVVQYGTVRMDLAILVSFHHIGTVDDAVHVRYMIEVRGRDGTVKSQQIINDAPELANTTGTQFYTLSIAGLVAYGEIRIYAEAGGPIFDGSNDSQDHRIQSLQLRTDTLYDSAVTF